MISLSRPPATAALGIVLAAALSLSACRSDEGTAATLLETLLRADDTPVSRANVLREVWGPDFDGDPNVIDVYIGYLRRKLGRDTAARSRSTRVRSVEPGSPSPFLSRPPMERATIGATTHRVLARSSPNPHIRIASISPMHDHRTDRKNSVPVHDRRTFLFGVGAVLLAACSDTADDSADGAAATTSTPASSSSTSSPSGSSDTSDGDDETDTSPAEGATSELDPLTPAMFDALPICALAPSTAAGPFPTLEQLDRRDVTEGYAGHPVRLGIRVVDPACTPIAGAQVEIWHTDATGDYSSYEDDGSGKDEGEGTTFLRGFQTSDDDGILEFLTIYPGWYEGRAVHIHVRARVDGDEVLTSQLYLDEAYTETVMATGPYAEFGPPDTSWADDGLIGDPTSDGTGIVLTAAPTELGDGTLGLINLGVTL